MAITKELLRRQSAELSLEILQPQTMRESISLMMDQGFFQTIA